MKVAPEEPPLCKAEPRCLLLRRTLSSRKAPVILTRSSSRAWAPLSGCNTFSCDEPAALLEAPDSAVASWTAESPAPMPDSDAAAAPSLSSSPAGSDWW